MTDPRNTAHDRKVEQEKKHHGIASSHEQSQPGEKPAQDPVQESLTVDHGPDADEAVDKTESGQEP